MPAISRLSFLCLLIIEGHHALIHPSQRPVRSSTCHYIQGALISRHHGSSISSSTTLSSTPSDQEPSRRVKIRARSISKGSSSTQRSATLSRPKRKSKLPSAKSTSKSTVNKEGKKATVNKASKKTNVDKASKKAKSKIADDNKPEYKHYKPTPHTKSGAPFQHQEMMDHTILTKEEELTYGRQVVRARELKGQIDVLLEERRTDNEVIRLEMEEMGMEGTGEALEGGFDMDYLSYELEYLSVYGFRPGQDTATTTAAGNSIERNDDGSDSNNSLGGFDLDDDLLIDHAQHRSHHISQLRNNNNNPSSNSKTFTERNTNNERRGKGPKRTGYRNDSTSLQSSAAPNSSNSYTPLLHIPIHELTESDVTQTLNISGGKSQLVEILLEGSYAREVLMRRNVKLVMSIAKNWMRNSFSTANANMPGAPGGGGSGSGGTAKKGQNDKPNKRFLSQMYEGSWDRPSLDEAAQEGMLGLARAVDKYDPERGLRFSTYATHWITSYVRVAFQRAVTGCLRVPSQLHHIKAAYNKIVKDHLHLGSNPPAQENIAQQLGISTQRLHTAIRATGTLLSVDAPVMSSGGSYKGSMAGGDGSNSQELLILDTLKCAEPRPEDQVEISFLRQCLENAMATELTPYERDVLRLRLGLDNGEGKTVREIAEISGGSITMSDVRSAERRAFKKLRSPTSVHTHNLLAYLDWAGADKGTILRR
mmetsp:Transcript_8785/g.19684  ORF Transcript_8785/g.19684 Transcript_8785/m.19684 type:complete len:706 (-) Transcript_8785:67-2184(-)